MIKKSFLILISCMSFNFCGAMTQSLGEPPETVSLLNGKFVFSRVYLGQISDFFWERGIQDDTRTDCIGLLDDGDTDCDRSFIYRLHAGNRVFSDRHDLVFFKIKIKELSEDKFVIWCSSCFVVYVHSVSPLLGASRYFTDILNFVFSDFSKCKYNANLSLLINDILGTLLNRVITLFKLLDERSFQHPYNSNISQEFKKSAILIRVCIPECLHCLDVEMLLKNKIINEKFEALLECPICLKKSKYKVVSDLTEKIAPAVVDLILQHKIPTPIGLLNQQQ